MKNETYTISMNLSLEIEYYNCILQIPIKVIGAILAIIQREKKSRVLVIEYITVCSRFH